MLTKGNAFKVLTIRKSLNINDEPLLHNVGFGLSESCYKQLQKASQETGSNLSELIRMALDFVIFNDDCIEVFKSQKKENDKFIHRRTVKLNKAQFDKISELGKTYKMARSEIIRKSIKRFLNIPSSNL